MAEDEEDWAGWLFHSVAIFLVVRLLFFWMFRKCCTDAQALEFNLYGIVRLIVHIRESPALGRGP